MKKILSMLLAAALLFSSLPLLPQPAAAEEPPFTLSGLESGASIGQVAVKAPENAPYDISISKIVHSDRTATTAEETFQFGDRYWMILTARPLGEEAIKNYFTPDNVKKAMAPIKGLDEPFVMPDGKDVRIRIYFDPDLQANDAGALSVSSPETIHPEVGVPLLPRYVLAKHFSLQNEANLHELKVSWYNQIEKEYCPDGYVPKANDQIGLRVFLYWKHGYDYGLTPDKLLINKLRSLMGNNPNVRKVARQNGGNAEYKHTTIQWVYDCAAPTTTDARITLQGDGVSAVPASGHKAGDTVTLTLSAPAGKSLDKLEVNGKDVSADVKDNQYSFTLAKENIVSVSWKGESETPAQPATLTLHGEGLAAVPASGHKVGDSVTLTLSAPAGKTLDKLEVNGKDVTAGVKDNQYRFTLEKKNSATVSWKDASDTPVQPTVLTLNGAGLTAVPASGHKAGDSVTLVLTAPAGKSPAKLDVNGKDVSADVKDNQYSFTLVETNSVAVTWRDVAAAAAGLDLLGENVSASPAKAGSYAEGEAVTLTLTPPADKELAALTVNGVDKTAEVKEGKLTITFAKGTQVAVSWEDKAPAPVAPAQPATTTVLTIGSKVLVRTANGVTGTTVMDVAPYINPGQNRTMLPLRAVGEILGLQVEWDAATRTVSVTGEGVNAVVPVDGKVIILNGKPIPVDASAEIKNSRTMMSIANLGTALGLERDKNIIWDGNTRTVTIIV